MARFGRAYPIRRVFFPRVPPTALYSATGVGTQGTTSPLTWTDTIPTTANCAVLWVANRTSVASPTISATFGGVGATLVSTIFNTGSSGFFDNLLCYVLQRPPTGSQTISFTTTSILGCSANIVYYGNVTSIGTPVTATALNSSATISTRTVPKSMYAQSFTYIASAIGQGFSSYNQTQRSAQNALTNVEPLVIGDASGTGSSITFSANCATAAGWAGIILPIL